MVGGEIECEIEAERDQERDCEEEEDKVNLLAFLLKGAEEAGAVGDADGVDEENQSKLENDVGYLVGWVGCAKCEADEEDSGDTETAAEDLNSADQCPNRRDEKE